jgi:hypothetical protein
MKQILLKVYLLIISSSIFTTSVFSQTFSAYSQTFYDVVHKAIYDLTNAVYYHHFSVKSIFQNKKILEAL